MDHEFLGWIAHQAEYFSGNVGITLEAVAVITVEPGIWRGHKALHFAVWKAEPRTFQYPNFSFSLLLEDEKGKK